MADAIHDQAGGYVGTDGAGRPEGIPAGGPPEGILLGAGGPPEGIPHGAGGPPAGAPLGAGGPPAGVGGPPAGGPPVGGPPPGIGGPPPGAGGPPGGGQGAPPGEDPVTGALNVPGFGMGYGRTIAQGAQPYQALWYIDIRNFRSVNPNYGFIAGNNVLKTLVAGIRKYISHELPVARLGADRFILLSCDLDFDAATAAFHDMIDWVRDQLAEMGIVYKIALTGGIYYLTGNDYANTSFSKALDYASIAHRNAHANPTSNLVLFTDEDLERDNRRITIEQSIDEALASGQVEVWYQPQVDYMFGDVVGAEALARWNHPELGWISPAEFIPVLEKCGKVHELDLFVWEEACRSAGRWRNVSDGNPVPISVNVSRAEMFEEGLMEHFLDLQRKYDLPEGSLHIEVTESAFVEEAERLYAIIEEMRDNNMRVEMDDFGSGLSSLHMLKDVPVDVVKLDMGFMRTAVNEERGGVVLGSVIKMLQGLDTPIIAEGVETLEQAEMLKNMGCHLMQGFHFSRPMPLDEFEDFIGSSNAVENADRRTRKESHLEDLMSFDPTSSYLFNNAIGGMMLFLVEGEKSESILVNDQFYLECGLSRDQFGTAKVNPIHEIDEESRATLWRTAAEARQKGSAACTAKIRLTGCWIDCVMRYISSSARGDVYSLSVRRSDSQSDEGNACLQVAQNTGFNIELINAIVPNGFVKCAVNDDLAISYISPQIIELVRLTAQEFTLNYHNSLLEAVDASDRPRVAATIREAVEGGGFVDIECNAFHTARGAERVQFLGRVVGEDGREPQLYGLVLLKGAADREGSVDSTSFERIVPFDYYVDEDKLVVTVKTSGAPDRQVVFEGWLEKLDTMPENIASASAAKAIATVRDLRHHPVSGFSDIKCNLRGGDGLRWYHVNYTCEADEEGNTRIIHGYAQDANDQMGSTKWWRRQAETDYLTGLLNRNTAEQEINVSMRTEGSGMLFMIDLDNFKRINDELGHLTGDALLRDVSDVLSKHFRGSDVLCRYGGDEFVAFMPVSPDTAHDLAKRRAADIVADISQVQIPDGTHAACSVGVAIANDRDATFYDLLEVADQAMYVSKEGGKGIYTVKEMV